MEAIQVILLIGVIAAALPESNSAAVGSHKLSCEGKLSKISNTNELYSSLLPRVISPSDDNEKIKINQAVLKYLTTSPTFANLMGCSMPSARLLQEDEDGGDDDDGGGGGGTSAINTLLTGQGGNPNNPLDNSNVLLGVRRILTNVFTGNLVGVIQESVGLRSPAPVATAFTDVLSTLFGSQATAGATGIIGNVTTTIRPPAASAPVQQPQQAQQVRPAQVQQQPQRQVNSDTTFYQQVIQQQMNIQQLHQQGVIDQRTALGLQQQLLLQAQAHAQKQQLLNGGDGGGTGASSVVHRNVQKQQFQQPQHQFKQIQQQQQPRPQFQQSNSIAASPAQSANLQNIFQESQLGGNSLNNKRRRPVQTTSIVLNTQLNNKNQDNDEDNEDDYA